MPSWSAFSPIKCLQVYEQDRDTEVGAPVQVSATPDGSGFVALVAVAPAARRAFAVLAAAGSLTSQLSAVSDAVVAGGCSWGRVGA